MVIIGGGVVGTSAAFHLAEAGVEGVLLLEQGELGSGSTVRAAGGFRAQFSDELNIAIALRSIAAFEAFAERPGWDISLHQDGYLFLLTDRGRGGEPSGATSSCSAGLGVPTEWLSPERHGSARRSSRWTTCWRRPTARWTGMPARSRSSQGYASGARSYGADDTHRRRG